MDYVEAPVLARRIMAFAFGPEAPSEIANRLQSIPGVQADVICSAGEILYAHYDLLPEAGKVLTGQIFLHAKEQGWTTYNKGTRSAEIVALVRRDVGETGMGVAPDYAEWPAPTASLRDGVDWRPVAPEPEPEPLPLPAPEPAPEEPTES